MHGAGTLSLQILSRKLSMRLERARARETERERNRARERETERDGCFVERDLQRQGSPCIFTLQHTTTTLQHTARRCNSLQHTATCKTNASHGVLTTLESSTLAQFVFDILCVQCAAVCCSVLQCVAVCCSVLQCVAVCCSVLQYSTYCV